MADEMSGPELDSVVIRPEGGVSVRPADQVQTSAVKPGAETTEYAETRRAAIMSTVLTVLGLITTFGSSIASMIGADTNAGIIVGGVIAVAGQVCRTLNQLGYVKSRTDVKVG